MHEILSIGIVGIGGFVGSIVRFLVSRSVSLAFGAAFPYGTLAVNTIGSFVMGLLFVLFVDRFSDSTLWRAGILIGMLGGFTTFSSFSIETFNLVEAGELLKAGIYVAGTLVLCVFSTWFGVLLARQL